MSVEVHRQEWQLRMAPQFDHHSPFRAKRKLKNKKSGSKFFAQKTKSLRTGGFFAEIFENVG